MTERTRIENPTCETCRWFRRTGLSKVKDGIYRGLCQHTLTHEGFIEIYADDFCSHHESAFDDPEWNQARADMLQRHSEPTARRGRWYCEKQGCENWFNDRGKGYLPGGDIFCPEHRENIKGEY